MKWLLSKLTGIAQAVWGFVLPLLKSQVSKLLADERVQKLALSYVEQAVGKDLDGDGKHDWAVGNLAGELAFLGIEYTKAGLGIAIEAAYQQWQGQR